MNDKETNKNNNTDYELVTDLKKEKVKDVKPDVISKEEAEKIVESLQMKAISKNNTKKKIRIIILTIILIIFLVGMYFMYIRFIKPTIGNSKNNGQVDEPINEVTTLDKLKSLGYEEKELASRSTFDHSITLDEFEGELEYKYTKGDKEYELSLNGGVYSLKGEETKELLTGVTFTSALKTFSNNVYQFVVNDNNEIYLFKNSLVDDGEYSFSKVATLTNYVKLYTYTTMNNIYFFYKNTSDEYVFLASNIDNITPFTLKDIDSIAYIKPITNLVIYKDKTITINGEKEAEHARALIVKDDEINTVITSNMYAITGLAPSANKIVKVLLKDESIALLYDDNQYKEYLYHELIN
jgi:hypothetical protein